LIVKSKLTFKPHNPQLFTDAVKSAQVPLQQAGKTPEHFNGVKDQNDLQSEPSHVEKENSQEQHYKRHSVEDLCQGLDMSPSNMRVEDQDTSYSARCQ
jgi:hypothetical protein